MKIGIIGLGRLGSCLAQVLAEHNEVVGVDKYTKWIDGIATSTSFSILKDCEIVFNVVNTPSLSNGDFSNEILFNSINQAKDYLNCKVFVIVSTVMPGTCEQVSKMLNCSVCYNPEFIRLNSIIDDMKNPDFVLVGEKDKESGKILENIYKEFVGAPIKHMSLKSAELAKIALNSYITMKITFANIIGQISKQIGADAEQILDTIGQDHRIGTSYFKSGGAYGGPCFPRDNIAFSNVAGNILNYAQLTDKINKQISKDVGFFSDDERYRSLK